MLKIARAGVLVSALCLFCGAASAQDQPAAPPAEGVEAAKTYNPEEWREPVQKASSQLDLLEFFAQATRFGGVTVKVPRELQRVPLESIKGAEKLADKDIEIYVRELTFKDLVFNREREPLWLETRPVLPVLLDFSTVGVAAEAKTKLGVIPLGAVFSDGKLPFDFDLRKDGYDLGILPERRQADANLSNLKLKVGGSLASGVANTFFKDDVAKLIMQYGLGQTLKMDKAGLLGGGEGGPSIPGLKKGSVEAEAAGALINVLTR